MADWVARVLNFKRGELPLALLSALLFFCVLCGYFFLRPVREAMGVSRGMDSLRWLFAVTTLASLVLVLAFGGVISRLNRRRALPVAYLFVIVCLLGFSGLLIANVRAGGGLIGSATETGLARNVGYTFYVWLSAINLFLNSLFWAFMVDIFNVDQGKRMFAFIGIGGTLGAIVGGWATAQVSGMTESRYLPAGLMLTGAAFFGLAIVIILLLDRMAVRSDHSRLGSQPAGEDPTTPPARDGEPRHDRVGGNFWDGLVQVVVSPYLLGIAGYIVFLAISNTLIYFTQANIVLDEADSFSQLIEGFAWFDMLAQVATLFTQIFITTRIIRRLGVGWTLAILPLVTAVGFGVLALWPIYGVMAIFQAIHRATRYAISRPSRETLFAVVPPAEKYKAKPVIDVFLYRGGDLAGMGIERVLSGLGSIGLLAGATVPFAAVWCGLSVVLGRAQKQRQSEP
ncbi:MAG: hypothetical protein K8E66_11745, partial [Phycisphaerales bacterium]|nr:hypothetical protein [Phycisphaerales bacterium]